MLTVPDFITELQVLSARNIVAQLPQNSPLFDYPLQNSYRLYEPWDAGIYPRWLNQGKKYNRKLLCQTPEQFAQFLNRSVIMPSFIHIALDDHPRNFDINGQPTDWARLTYRSDQESFDTYLPEGYFDTYINQKPTMTLAQVLEEAAKNDPVRVFAHILFPSFKRSPVGFAKDLGLRYTRFFDNKQPEISPLQPTKRDHILNADWPSFLTIMEKISTNEQLPPYKMEFVYRRHNYGASDIFSLTIFEARSVVKENNRIKEYNYSITHQPEQDPTWNMIMKSR